MVKKTTSKTNNKKRKSRVAQSDIPSYSLSDALKVAVAIFDNYAGDPTAPLKVAEALGITPSSSGFRMLTGASVAYGLTKGGYGVDKIETTPLSKRIVRSTEEGDDIVAKRQALLKPRIINEFLRKYDGSPIPTESIAANVIEDMGAPRDRAISIFKQIVSSAENLGLITTIKNKQYVYLEGSNSTIEEPRPELESSDSDEALVPESSNSDTSTQHSSDQATKPISDAKAKKVFITHGKNKSLVEPIKRFLTFGELEPVVSVEKESTSLPVPEKVMQDMRSCGAAIIHVAGEETLISKGGEERVVLNSNVLIEIGAAMALYGKRFILLVKDGTELPSNLQGLYQVRYNGEELGSEGTMKLLSAIEELKKLPLLH